jgi:hypothetical protein
VTNLAVSRFKRCPLSASGCRVSSAGGFSTAEGVASTDASSVAPDAAGDSIRVVLVGVHDIIDTDIINEAMTKTYALNLLPIISS